MRAVVTRRGEEDARTSCSAVANVDTGSHWMHAEVSLEFLSAPYSHMSEFVGLHVYGSAIGLSAVGYGIPYPYTKEPLDLVAKLT